MWKESLKWNTNKLLSVCIFVGRLSSLLFDNGVFSFLLFDLFLLLLMKSNLLYFDGNGRRATQSFVFLIGVRYPSPSLFVPPFFFFIVKHKRRRRVRLFCIDFGKIQFHKTKRNKREGRQFGEWKRHWSPKSIPTPSKKKKKLLHLYIRRPIRHARLTLIFVYYYYVYISAFFFFQIDCTRFSISYNNNNNILSLCYWNETKYKRVSESSFLFSLFLVFCFIVQPVVYE